VGLLSSSEPAQAKTYGLTVSIHQDLRGSLSEGDVKEILKKASDLLRHTDAFWINNCDVAFELEGPLQTFASAPARIDSAEHLEAAHHVRAHVKVVGKINYCLGKYDKEGFAGCAWRDPRHGKEKTVIVTPSKAPNTPNVWLHELGHTTCLPHRVDSAKLTLMTPCSITSVSWRITQAECLHFVDGPKLCPPKQPVVKCPAVR
jgi:hypothetical protein